MTNLSPPRRYVIAVLCLWISIVYYCQRVSIGIAIPSFIQSKKMQGQVHAAFFYGYTCSQVIGDFDHRLDCINDSS